ncbi:hypothetical protein [Aquimarina megaterium]|uniref:hypothetical protein n=1 Tax=Aquimarina megaterium TaxID=1443666 RepID=UPI0011128CCC|nr:hypothetical protein [Aquimarina megaterium]
MKMINFSKNLFLLTFLIVNYNLFSQDTQIVLNSLQGKWSMCRSAKSRTYCGPNPNEQKCDYQIQIKEDEFVLFQNNKEVDYGKFELEHHYDQVFITRFYSSSSDEIFEILDVNNILLFYEENEEYFFFMEAKQDHQRICSLKKI